MLACVIGIHSLRKLLNRYLQYVPRYLDPFKPNLFSLRLYLSFFYQTLFGLIKSLAAPPYVYLSIP